VQRLDRLDPAWLVGSGKAREIADLVHEQDAGLVLILNDLRPRQRKNLEKVIAVPIVDRTMLILDVFARSARSREGKLQVELAQLRYRQSNLIGVGADLSRLGGGIGTRGPGETKLEVDRRRIQSRISVLRAALDDVRRQRETRRSAPHREPLAALVGYTNAGKSSLLNALARSNVFVADQPFATLDPTVRRVYLAPGDYVRVADTVGFITDLPKDLVNAFRATLDELREADLLVHVLDASNHDWPRQKAAVESLLRELELEAAPRLLVFNKTDAAGAVPSFDGAVATSARTGFGLDALREAMNAMTKLAALVVVLLFVVCSCAPDYPDDRFVGIVREMKPSVVLLTMRVPPEKKSDGYDDAYGTGLVVASGPWGSDILTVAHVVDQAWNVHATVGNKAKVPARVIAIDDDRDVALLRTKRPNLPVVTLAGAPDLHDQIGREIALLGYPIPDEFEDEQLGLATSLDTGRLSSLRNDALEVTLQIVPGESGGPVFLADNGTIIGLADSRFDDERSIGFAVPIRDALRFLHRTDRAHGF